MFSFHLYPFFLSASFPIRIARAFIHCGTPDFPGDPFIKISPNLGML
ncbi:hypothetical protein AB434_2855 [Heyndrickxia coagulans]|nr:hypothetical protein AB434_2855 [Heyndrickxia coagulans]